MMLQSWKFLLGFFPTVVIICAVLTRYFSSQRLAVGFLTGASFLFAFASSVGNALLILISTLFNYLIARLIRRGTSDQVARWMLTVGIAANIVLLGYFKYLEFLVDNLNQSLGFSFHPQSVNLVPVGLSFLTFQQIAFLVECYRGHIQRESFTVSHYVLFCAFFPKQLAGPIVRPQEFLPQITSLPLSVNSVAFLEGLTRFVFGYFEKVVVADTLASYVNPVFDAVWAGHPVGCVAAWGGLLAFTFQLYFDFVGYTDMALGAARMVGFSLPENFLSPYKAISISDFWRRWHMTLSRFLRDYLYIPLGGNQKGLARQIINMMITMLLGGLWHGASWTFVLWGFLHGIYLGVNHSWRRWGWECPDRFGWGFTFASVAYAWVWFRAESVETAWSMTQSLVGLNGLWSEGLGAALRAWQQPTEGALASIASLAGLLNHSLTYGHWTLYPVHMLLSEPSSQLIWLIFAALLVWKLPNAQEWLEHRIDDPDRKWSAAAGAVLASLMFIAMLVSLHDTTSTFVYSKF